MVSHDDFELLIASVRSVGVPDTSGNCPVVDSHLETKIVIPRRSWTNGPFPVYNLELGKRDPDESLISVNKLFQQIKKTDDVKR